MATNPNKDVQAGMAGNPDPVKDAKIILDPIYGIIRLDPLAVRIIDTHYFHRLRYIKQLSFADYVYPGATHTRFAHSIGVYHLACEMIKVIGLQGLGKDVGLSEMEETCIRVAALCHDIGHGPFSHAYEHIGKDELQDVKHEAISEFLLEKMFEDSSYKLVDDGVDIQLIKDLIQGNYEKYVDTDKKAKKYMFQIVSNKNSGMDVDKWDYFNRDAIACGVPERFQFDRALHVARVVNVNGVYELGYRDYDAFSFYSMYNTRFTLYRKVYRHKVVVAVELMIRDVFHLVGEANKSLEDSDERLKIDLFPVKHITDEEEKKTNMRLGVNTGPNTDNKFLMIDDYLKLRDDVLLKIQDSKVDGYQEARKLIQRLQKRKLYKLFKELKVLCHVDAKQTEEKVRKIQEDLNSELEKKGLKDHAKIKEERFDYGMKQHDPVEKMYFYRKGNTNNPETLQRHQVSFVLPNVFQEHYVRVYETFSENTFSDNKKTDLKNELNSVLESFEEKYKDDLVIKRRSDAQSTQGVESGSSMSNMDKEG